LEATAYQVAQFEMTLSLREQEETISGGIEYAIALFERSTIERYLGYFRKVLEGMIADPSLSIDRLAILPDDEREQVLYRWNDTAASFPDKCLHELFELQVESTPEATAVTFEDQELSYAGLNRRANQLAHYLRGQGLRPDDRVAICIDRGLEMMVALLAVLKAGGAYVPLDPAYPVERLQFMLQDSVPVALVTQKHLTELFPRRASVTLAVVLDGENRPWDGCSDGNPDSAAIALTSKHLAYVIYTSGSTGTPKGVMIDHSALMNFLYCMQGKIAIGPGDVWLAITTLSFDIAALELFLPLLSSACLRILSPQDSMDGVRLISELQNGVTVMQATPATWHLLLQSGWQKTSGLKILCGGETLSSELAEKLINNSSSAWNLYGPTETTIWSMLEKLQAIESTITVGQPLTNTRIYILDAQGEPVPVGVAGEIYIGGAGVARGYFNRPELTAERFLKDPFISEPEARIYKTGDLGRWLPDGRVEFLGRNDLQVKIRGFRIELGEIEARLTQHPAVGEAVISACEDASGDKRLVAYYVPRTGEWDAPGVNALRAHLSASLPEYMVPAAYVRLEAMPLTPNGKIDRKALPSPDVNAYTFRRYEEPQGEMEHLLSAIWAEVLKQDRVGRHDHFFELGGHSLLAMQVIERMRQNGISADVRKLFMSPTLAELAAAVASAEPQVQVPANKIPAFDRSLSQNEVELRI
jgi:amino acid adenylation domain-containing protein